MKSYSHFTPFERFCLQCLLNQGRSIRFIAKSLDRSPSSVSREIKRNWSKKAKRYHYWNASIRYIERRKSCHRKNNLLYNIELYNFVLVGLQQFWSPELIAGRWNKDHSPKIAFSSIYRAVRAGLFPNITPKTHFRRRNKPYSGQSKIYTIFTESSIHDRPQIIDVRGRVGDMEGDTVYGSVGKGYLVTAIDRQTRVVTAALTKDKTKESTNAAFVRAFAKLKFPVQTMTLDNGTEFLGYKDLEQQTDTTIYFADSHAPWQRGSNENINGLFRFFFPRGTNFNEITEEELNAVIELLNNRPRKCLGYLTPYEYLDKVLHLA